MSFGKAIPATIGFLCLASSVAMTGCKPSGSSSGEGDAALIASGKTVFNSQGCARCHSLNGQGGRMGPDLTHEGAKPGHTPDWIVVHVKNPKTHNPGSRMPAFEGKINDKDLQALGAYLASLK
jgi:mono/diheme cytochrome c family protein